MTDPLQPYRAKRDFARSPEPQGGAAAGDALRFVVQKHAARNLHYDFRLELDGTLRSWAVPKGPSLDPHDKRMAVQVEDHPLDYAGFEGTIPPGHYGAGTVIVWDNGTWEPEGDPRRGLADGKLKFRLHGHKLDGGWTLVRMRGRGSERQTPWLLIKEQDDAARPAAAYNVVEAAPDSVLAAPAKAAKGRSRKVAAAAAAAALPLSFAPQLATLVDAVPAEGDWLYEIKFDGYRLLARIDGADDVRLFTRNGHDWTAKLKGLARELGRLGLRGWLDGEIVVQDAHGVPDFQALQNAFDAKRTQDILYFLFDAPFLDGRDLRAEPLRERRRLLRAALEAAPAQPHLRFSEDFAVAASDLLHTACQMRMEGVIGKRADAPYTPGRGRSWIKLKCQQRQEFVIGGYTDPKGSRSGLGALLLGVHDAAGTLHYAGNVGTGFSQHTLDTLAQRLATLHVDRAPFEHVPAGVRGHWVRPTLVAEVSFAEWTKEGRVRHAVFHGLRDDKPPRAVSREAAVPPPAPAKAKRSAKPAAQVALPAGLRLTHGERVVDAASGTTKRALAEYAARAAGHWLPHLKGRPVALLRAPEGVGGEAFFQKHDQGRKIPGLRQLDPSLDPGHGPLMTVADRAGLLGSVQMNMLELHTWNAKADAIERPDRMTFDLDPGDGVAWPQVREAAELVRTMLDALGLQALLKTSGGKGLHVVVPFRASHGWDTVKGLSQRIVQHLAATLPERFVAKSGPRNRVGRIFADYLRNGRGATTVSAWSPRARPGIGVSVPVRWEELPSLEGGAHWTLATIDERLALADPWTAAEPPLRRQTLRKAMQVLDFVPKAS